MSKCPVITAFLKEMLILNDFDSPLNSSLVPQLDNLQEMLAVEPKGTLVRQQQRGFFCVEYMASKLLVSSLPQQELGFCFGWPRSRGGLTHLLAGVKSLLEELLGGIVEYDILYGDDVQVPTQLLENQQHRTASIICQHLGSAAFILRHSLRNSDVHLSRVGLRVARSMQACNCSVIDMLVLVRELLNHGEREVLRAWQIAQMR